MNEHILKARESRFNTIQALAKKHNILVSLKANTPGDDKNRYSSHFLITLFEKQIKKAFNIGFTQLYQGYDGPFFLFSVEEIYHLDVKKKLMNIEDNYPLGRLIDLDLYVAGQMISRDDLKSPKRKCLICELDAFVCARNRTHSIDSLLSIIDTSILDYLKSHLTSIIDTAILNELNLEHKFGLVTPLSSGSHSDMNYDLMFKSKDVIIPYLVKMFELSFIDPDDKRLFEKARIIGIEAEDDMFRLTDHVNTYKGLIYVLGFVLLALGINIKKNIPLEDIYDTVKDLASHVLLDFDKSANTAGQQAFANYKMTGIRGEVYNGLPTIQKANRHFEDINSQSQKNQHAILLFIMLHSEDTVLLKRATSLQNYIRVKKMVEKVNAYDEENIIKFSQYCIKQNLSFGGSADLFIVFHFLNLIKPLLS